MDKVSTYELAIHLMIANKLESLKGGIKARKGVELRQTAAKMRLDRNEVGLSRLFKITKKWAEEPKEVEDEKIGILCSQ